MEFECVWRKGGVVLCDLSASIERRFRVVRVFCGFKQKGGDSSGAGILFLIIVLVYIFYQLSVAILSAVFFFTGSASLEVLKIPHFTLPAG